MSGRLVLVLLVAAFVYYLNDSGLLTYCTNSGMPGKGRICTVAGPTGTVYFSPTEFMTKFEIDSHIGTAQEKWAAHVQLARYVEQGEIFELSEGTKVQVLQTKRVLVQSAPHWITQVKLLGGELKGAQGWVNRADVIDCPVQQIYQSMRKTKKIGQSAKLMAAAGTELEL